MNYKNTLQDLDQFKVGDKVTIYNTITRNASYYGTIQRISPKAYIKDGKPSRSATILDDMGMIHENYLGSAKKH